jgi:hypothetical protein
MCRWPERTQAYAPRDIGRAAGAAEHRVAAPFGLTASASCARDAAAVGVAEMTSGVASARLRTRCDEPPPAYE